MGLTQTVSYRLTVRETHLAAVEALSTALLALNAADDDYAVQTSGTPYGLTTEAFKAAIDLMLDGSEHERNTLYQAWLDNGGVREAIAGLGWKLSLIDNPLEVAWS